MSDSIIYFNNHELQFIESDQMLNLDDRSEVMDIVFALKDAGYKGIELDTTPIEGGRHFVSISWNPECIAGLVFECITYEFESGRTLPQPARLVEAIRSLSVEQHDYLLHVATPYQQKSYLRKLMNTRGHDDL